MTARFGNADETRLVWTDANDVEWSGIPCHLDGERLIVDSDTEIARRVVAWLAAGNTPTAYSPPAPTAADVAAERDRRLAGGFSYDFGDARGVHVFATTEADLRGWRDVSDYAAALRANGDTVTTIAILTDTGATAVTAAEWADILIAAAAFRQPIWAASFALQAMDPIPADYDDDSRWP